jgi:gluconolactonase
VVATVTFASWPALLFLTFGPALWPTAVAQQLEIAAAVAFTEGVYVISPRRKLLKFIPIPEDLVTNNAFGGPDMKTLYITAGKNLYKVRTEIPGLSR